MGWDFNTAWSKKKDAVAGILALAEKGGLDSCPTKVLASKVAGNELWVVYEIAYPSGPKKVINLHLLGRDGPCWGEKSMPASWGPSYYKCPVEFFALAPEPESATEAGWRAKVVARAACLAALANVMPGDIIEVGNGWAPGKFCVIATGKKLLGQKVFSSGGISVTGPTYRLNPESFVRVCGRASPGGLWVA